MTTGPKVARGPGETPAALGFRMPAEWEPQAAVWLSWPHKRRTWPGHFQGIPETFARIVAAISRFEEVRINVGQPLHAEARRLIQEAKADLARVTLFDHATNDCWCRDHGPIFVRNDRTGEVALTDWVYNAWGGKYPPFDLDNQIPARIAQTLGLRRFAIDQVLEGGSIDVNGGGLLLTTEACLLNQNRNPQLGRREIEQALQDHLGVTEVIWLGAGIAGDDTDGHVDDLSRFFRVDGIVTAVEQDPRDVNFGPLQENLARLRSLQLRSGPRPEIVELPMPEPCFGGRQRLPATYANFLVLNGAVLMPAFQQPRRDAEAAAVLAGCFPGREVIPVDCLGLVLGRGTLHCISQQQPAAGSAGVADPGAVGL